MIFGNSEKSYLEGLFRATQNSFKALSYQQITVSGSSQALTVPSTARYALCIVESDNTTAIVARFLETTQTTVAIGVGMPVKDGTVFDITDFANLSGFRIIQESANTTKINIQYYK